MAKPPSVKKHGVLLEPTRCRFEEKAVLNPACYQDGEFVHLFYRAIDMNDVSSIGYAKLRGPHEVVERWEHPILSPEYDYESRGIEDPRIVNIDGTFYMTYVAHDGKNAVTAYATSNDLITFVKEGIVSPRITYHDAMELFKETKVKDQYYLFGSFYEETAGKDVLIWHKDVMLFPEKINDSFVMLHRILPDIQIVFFDDFQDLTDDFWRFHLSHLGEYVVLENKHWFETRHVGGGAPPIPTAEGWLVIVHAAEETNKGRIYRAGAMLLDYKDPRRVIGKLHEPLFEPEETYEVGSVTNIDGEVANVVFPTGTALFGDDLYIYYGAADKRIAAASVSLSTLISALKSSPRHDHG